MQIKVNMVYLGMEQKESKKTGSAYFMIKLIDPNTDSIFEFYTPQDKVTLISAVAQLQKYMPYSFVLKISSYQGKAQVDLEGLANEGK